jgi:hypothetical protein
VEASLGKALKTSNRDTRYRLVLEKKQVTSASELYSDLPAVFIDHMNHVHNLRDEDKPDYWYLRGIFGGLSGRQGFEYDDVFDWTILESRDGRLGSSSSCLAGGHWRETRSRYHPTIILGEHVKRGNNSLNMRINGGTLDVRLPDKDGNPDACTAASLVAFLARFGNNGTILQSTKLQRCLHIKTMQAIDGSRIHPVQHMSGCLGGHQVGLGSMAPLELEWGAGFIEGWLVSAVKSQPFPTRSNVGTGTGSVRS